MQTFAWLSRKHLRVLITLLLFTTLTTLYGQDNLPYQMPPTDIANLMDAPPTPSASLSPSGETMLMLSIPSLPSVEEVAQEELRLAGLRLNPKTTGSSRSFYYNGLKFKSLKDDTVMEVKGLPDNPKIENVSWSPDGSKVAFTITQSSGLELWMVDANTAKPMRLTNPTVNDAMSGLPYRWFPDGRHILYKSVALPRGPIPSENNIPSGPIIQENKGKSAPVRTYQDLLKNAHDEALFEYYTLSQMRILTIGQGEPRSFGKKGIIKSFSISPDGKYVMVATIQKPFSYIVPYSRFPYSVEIYDDQGMKVNDLAQIPLAENIPKGFGAVREGPRSFAWRPDQPATLYWTEAQDGGDPKKESNLRDQMYYVEAPFSATPKKGPKFSLRYGGIDWTETGTAITYEWWWQDRRAVTSMWDPEKPNQGKTTLFDYSWEDRYNDPGDFESKRNQYGRSVLIAADNGKTLFLTGRGASPEGNRPFVDKFNLITKSTERLWRSEAPYFENPITIIDEKEGLVLTRREGREEVPNYFLRNLKTGELKQITSFENPYQALMGVKKELVKYKRKDGVELTGTLYLPAGYDKDKDGRLPVLMWAYPREFKSADAASQVKNSPYEFIRIGWWSPLFWATQGYAVFDDFGMPIIGEGDEEPNETFVDQLVSGAQAAADKLVEMGVADRERLAVGGHSYGAFMTANLLAHSDIFTAGIARSGAYNRTLTPFGFQSEERTFWETPETYFKMSPFMHADKIKEPLLLIHGEADNNSGTFPMQSERFYGALKGHGAMVRLVMLPHESHGYRARESVMHMLWEMTEWLDTHVKNKGEEPVEKP